jgi:hypothetical protein
VRLHFGSTRKQEMVLLFPFKDGHISSFAGVPGGELSGFSEARQFDAIFISIYHDYEKDTNSEDPILLPLRSVR